MKRSEIGWREDNTTRRYHRDGVSKSKWREWERRLVSSLLWIDVVEQAVFFFLPYGDCVSAGGAIGLAQELCPKVTTVITMSGVVLDTCYLKDEEGLWQAKRAPEVAR